MNKRTNALAGMVLALPLLLGFFGCDSGGGGGTYVVVQSLDVSARKQGVTFLVTTPGDYRFTITGGAYTLGNGKWSTGLNIYHDRPVQTESAQGRPNPTNPDATVGDFELQDTRELAEQIGLGKEGGVSINEYAVLIVPDDLGTFGDNSGNISLLVERRE